MMVKLLHRLAMIYDVMDYISMFMKAYIFYFGV